MVDKITEDLMGRFVANFEAVTKDLEVKETVLALKRTSEIEMLYGRTSETIKKAKEILTRTVDSQIFGKDN